MSPVGKRVLLIEDEDHIRLLVSVILRRKGYVVQEASDGLQALALLRDAPAFDLFITDLQMPGLGGISLIMEMRTRFPNVPIVVISAYATADWAKDALENAVIALPKPFSHADLIRVVDDAFQPPVSL